MFARQDLQEIDEAKRIVFFGGAPYSPGKHFEIGYAYAKGYPVLVVSDKQVKERCSFISPWDGWTWESLLASAQICGVEAMDAGALAIWEGHLRYREDK